MGGPRGQRQKAEEEAESKATTAGLLHTVLRIVAARDLAPTELNHIFAHVSVTGPALGVRYCTSYLSLE